MDTLSETINTLNKTGYTEDFQATNQHIVALSSKKTFNPEEMKITESYRFEGMTDPADEVICFALEANDGTKGTLVMSFSSEHSQELETVHKIPKKR